MKKALGLLEVKGLALAIVVADTMAKAAAVCFEGAESSNGGGWTLVKISGDVAAVQAAISTGVALAQRQGGLVSHKVLSRPEPAVVTALVATVEESNDANVDKTLSKAAAAEPTAATTEIALTEASQTELSSESAVATSASAEVAVAVEAVETDTVSCNLCGDPACGRHKGEPRVDCLNAGERS